MTIERIDDLEQYHDRISMYVDKMLVTPNSKSAFMEHFIKVQIMFAEANMLPAPFVFQDEDARHFNHDVMLECKLRLA